METTEACEKALESFVADTLVNETGRKGGAANRLKRRQIKTERGEKAVHFAV
jgi:hypothetical protein